MNALAYIEQLREDNREERFQRAKALAEALQDAAHSLRHGMQFGSLPAAVQEHLLNCSDTYFNHFGDLVRGKRRSPSSPRKAS